jgi:hypothetical protein
MNDAKYELEVDRARSRLMFSIPPASSTDRCLVERSIATFIASRSVGSPAPLVIDSWPRGMGVAQAIRFGIGLIQYHDEEFLA